MCEINNIHDYFVEKDNTCINNYCANVITFIANIVFSCDYIVRQNCNMCN